MGDVKKLVEKPHPMREGLVSLLEDLLADAKAGRLMAIVGGAQRVGRETSSFSAVYDDTDAAKLWFSLENAKFRFLARENLEKL